MLDIIIFGFMLYNNAIILIIATSLICAVNATAAAFISFKSIDAQNNDYSFKHIQHMMGPGMHMMGPGMHMMGPGMQQQSQQTPNSFSNIIGNNMTDNRNSISISIVFGATSRTTDAYQPNPVYIKEGQTIIWINNDNNIHTVTQKNYQSFTNNFGNTLGFNSGILNKGQSFAQLFNKEGTYNYYCTIHPWMVGQVIVSENSISTNNNANTANTTTTGIINNK